MGRLKTIARRSFLVGSVAVAGGVAFGYWQYTTPYPNPLVDDAPEGSTVLTPYIRIDEQGITIITPRTEMGQGVHTTLAALVAEELDVDPDDIRTEHGPASYAYYNTALMSEGAPFAPTDDGWMAEAAREAMAIPAKFLALQVTGGSSSVPDAWMKMRKAGAAARLAMLEAAARKTGLTQDRLRTENGAVIEPGGTRHSYIELAGAAALVALPSDPPLKPRSGWRYLGKSLPRVDVVAKSTGTARYACDIRLPDMLFGTVRMNPRLGGALDGFDDTDAKAMPGVVRVVALTGGVAVIADNTWRAFRAAEAIDCKWGEGAAPASTAQLYEEAASSFVDDRLDSRFRDDGDVEAALDRAAEVISAEYRAPVLAHATMEPMSAVAWFRDGKLDVWAGTQAPTVARDAAADVSGLGHDAIRIHTVYAGGGFGRRSENDFIRQAVTLAKEMSGRPVSLMWSREEDMTHDYYRPPAIARFRGAIDEGLPSAWECGISSASVMESQFGRNGIPVMGPDKLIVDGALFQPYGIPDIRVSGYRAPAGLPLGYWRSVGASYNGFFHESFMDELAHAAGADPVEMRLKLLTHEPSRKVLEAVAEMAGWQGSLGDGRGRGVAFTYSFGVPTAEIVEVAMSEDGLRIEKAWIAADVGIALDPRNIEAQLSGGMIFGLSAAIQGEITLEEGMVAQSNFHDYDVMRLYQTPEIEVRVLENGDRIRGIGEPGTPPAAPALANAIFAATGKRIRELPLNKTVDFA